MLPVLSAGRALAEPPAPAAATDTVIDAAAPAAEDSSAEDSSTEESNAAVAPLDPLLQHQCVVLPPAGASPEQLADYEQRQLPIGEINIVVDPIFDLNNPDENNWLFALVNDLHIPTHDKVIRDDLLFGSGTLFSADQMAESERVLRTRRYLRDASIHPVGECIDKVDLEVRVKDVWTLVPDVGFSRSGGNNTSRFGFRDSNFLGTGTAVHVIRERDAERTGTAFGYRDPNFGNTHSVLNLEYTDNSDGKKHEFGLYRPFFSLETPWAGGLTTLRDLRNDSLYFRDDKIQSFEHDEESNSLFAGWSRGRIDHLTERWRFGINDERDDFAANDDTVPGAPLPENRLYRYGWLEWERVNDDYVKAVNINQMRRTEDINLGWSTTLRLGRTSSALGSVDQGWIYSAAAERYWLIRDDQVLYLSGDVNGIYQDQPLQQVSQLQARYHLGDFASHQFFAGLRLEHGRNLFVDQPLMLGGDNGLRGYPSHYQVGDRTALLTLEERFYLFTEVLSLFDVGAAVFADAGRAWYTDRDNGLNGGWLSDVGFGLRLTPTRTGNERAGKQTVLHLDIATPLDRDDDPSLDKIQWLVKVKESF